MAKKYYAVREGKLCGIFLDWENCRLAVEGVPGARYKSFVRFEDAEQFVAGKEDERSMERPYAFVDGSFNPETGVYGYGGFLVDRGERIILQGSGEDVELASMRNVAGEILGCMAAVGKAVERGLKELTVYYDYMGIEMWATGAWKRNKTGTIRYYEYMQSVRNELSVTFVKVKGHSGVEGNETADRLAREAVGL